MQQTSYFDKSLFPIVVVKFKGGEISEKEFDAHLDRMYHLYSEHDKILIVFDTSNAKYLSSTLRIKQGNWLKKHHKLLKDTIIAAVYVSSSVMMKMMLKGIFLVQTPAWEHKVVVNLDNGLEWAKEKLKEKGYEIQPR